MADYTDETTPIKSNPIGIEIPIQSIQIDLAEINWLELSYGRAFVQPVRKGSTSVVPMVYVGGRQHKNVLPNDNVKSQSFISTTSPEEFEEYDQNTNSQIKNVDLAVIVWVNLEKIDPNNKEIFTEVLKNDIEKVLSFNQYVGEIKEIFDEDANEIFRGYNIDLCGKELLMYPFAGLRFNINVVYESFCQ